MPRKAVLSAAQQAALIALPSAEHDLRLHYTLSENDLAIIRSKRGPHNRLGFAIQLCYLRFPGQAMTLEAEPPAELLAHVAQQIQVTPDAWTEYASRDETRREHALELQSVFGYRPFTIAEYRRLRGWLTDLALQTNKALALAEQLIESLRSQHICSDGHHDRPPVRRGARPWRKVTLSTADPIARRRRPRQTGCLAVAAGRSPHGRAHLASTAARRAKGPECARPSRSVASYSRSKALG